MKKIGYILFLLLTLTGANLFSQEDSGWFQGKIISDIQFEGLKNVSKSELDGVINQFIGEEFSDELFLELQTLMYELDYFEFIIPTPKPGDDQKQTVVLVFQVQESPSISKIVFKGNNSVKRMSLSGKILLKSKDIYSDYKVQRAKNEIILEYNNRGYSNVTVEVEKESDPEKNSLIITFVINEGEQTLIKEINFHGNNVFATDSELYKLIETKKKSLLKDGVYKESVIQGDKLLIEGHYHDNGYINAKVLDVKTTLKLDEKKKDLKNMVIDFYIEEGDQYTYGGMDFTGNTKFTTAEFDRYVTQKYGEIYNKSAFDSNFMRIQSLYYDSGYPYNSYQNKVEKDEENKIISHKITIVERGLAHIGDITFSGNTKTKDIVLLRNIQIEKGDVFSRRELQRSWSNLMNTRLFTAVNPIPSVDDEGNMDLHYEVEEARTLNLMMGISITGGSDPAPSFQFSLNNTNFMGMNRTIGGSINLGENTQSFSFNYKEPRILESNYYGGGSLGFSHKKSDILQVGTNADGDYNNYPTIVNSYEEYKEWLAEGHKVGDKEEDLHNFEIFTSVYAGHTWFKKFGILRAQAGYRAGVDSYFYSNDITPYSSEYRNKKVGEWYFNDRITTKFILDARDQPIGTMDGYGFSQRLDFGGILPIENEGNEENKSNYIKSVTTGDYYLNLVDRPITEAWDLKISLRAHGGYTRILKKPGLSLIDDDKTASIDGMTVGRGWKPEGNGVALLNLGLELLVPVVPNMIGSSLFFDAANLWTDDENTLSLNLDDFKFSYGATIGIINQIMPISFFVAKTFTVEDGSINWSHEEKYQKTLWGHATWGITFNMNFLLQ